MTVTLSADQLARCTGAHLSRAQFCLSDFTIALSQFGLDVSPQRTAMFLANVGEETGGLRFFRELWGAVPTPAQARYERDFTRAWPPTAADMKNALAFSLGNLNSGDGFKYRGGGALQITGHAGAIEARDSLVRRFGAAAVPDFERNPEQLAISKWAALTAADYVVRRGCLPHMDAGEFDPVCDLINFGRVTVRTGDANGFSDRSNLYRAARVALGIN